MFKQLKLILRFSLVCVVMVVVHVVLSWIHLDEHRIGSGKERTQKLNTNSQDVVLSGGGGVVDGKPSPHGMEKPLDETKETKSNLPDDLRMVEKRNHMRLENIKQTCHKRGLTPNYRQHVRAVMDPHHTVMWCRVNKAASTYTIDMFESIFNCSIDCLRSSAEEITALSYPKMRQAVAKAFKITFVREPYGRLFATYSNKFFFPKEDWAPIGPDAVKRYRNNPSMNSLKYGHDITFEEMIRYVVEQVETGDHLDEHLRPMNAECFPCGYQYDFIGKLETLVSDWNYLKALWSKKRHVVKIPEYAGEKKPDQHPQINHIITILKIIEGSDISHYNLYLRAWSYYQMIGYIYKHITMPFAENSEIRHSEFKLAVFEAREKSLLHASELKGQKFDAMKQAYDSLPRVLLNKLKRVVALDCKLYGYELTPEWVFKRSSQPIEFDYFKYLQE